MSRFLWALTFACIASGAVRPAGLSAISTEKRDPREAIFSGTVVTVTPHLVTVARKAVGHDVVTRVFALDTDTKIEGKLRAQTRVSVRYRALEGGAFLAEHIIVR